MKENIDRTYNQMLDNQALMSRTIYGVKSFAEPVLLYEPVERVYAWWEKVLMGIGLVLLLAFIAFTIFFYYHFPHQMVWLIPSLLMFALIRR